MEQQLQQIHHISNPISFIMNSEKSEISCIHCRAHHRRCDRSIPTCMECLTRGYVCAYRKPKKRGRKKQKEKATSEKSSAATTRSSRSRVNSTTTTTTSNSNSRNLVSESSRTSTNYHPYATNEDSRSSSLSPSSSSSSSGSSARYNAQWASQLVELYFQFSGKCPSIVEREQIEHHINNHADVKSDASVEIKAAQALLNAIQAVTLQRLGQKQDAQLMFEKTRELCLQADVYESHVSNYHVAAAMITMTMWLVGERREAAAKMYLNNVYFYIDQMQQQSDLAEKQKNELRNLSVKVGVVELMMSLNFFAYEEVERKATGTGGYCDLSAKKHMQSHLKKRLEICRKVLSCGTLSMENELNALFEEIFQNNCREENDAACVMMLRRTLERFERMDQHLQVMFKTMPALSLSWSILFQGFKLEVLADYEYKMVCNSDPAYLEKLEAVTNLKRFVADKISRKVLKHSAWFPLTCNLHLKYVVMTALIHMKHARSIGKDYTEEDALAFLKADLWALETTQKRYDFPRSTELINNLRSCIQIISARRDAMSGNNTSPTMNNLPDLATVGSDGSSSNSSPVPISSSATSPYLASLLSETSNMTDNHTTNEQSNINQSDFQTFPVQLCPLTAASPSSPDNNVSALPLPQGHLDRIDADLDSILNNSSFDEFLDQLAQSSPHAKTVEEVNGHAHIDFMQFGANSDLFFQF